MHEEPTTVIVQPYLDALPGDTAAELTVRELLERAAGRLRLLCTTLLYKSYTRLTWPPVILEPDELLGDADGTPKIGDFGLARRLDGGAGATLTGKLDDAERTRWRRQARDWLRADLAAWAKTLDKRFHGNPCSGQGNRAHWQIDPDLAGLRESSAMAHLPADGRTECLALWQTVGNLLRHAREAR